MGPGGLDFVIECGGFGMFYTQASLQYLQYNC